MINQQLLDYVHQQRSGGYSTEEIMRAATAAGWQEHDVHEAFTALAERSDTSTPPLVSGAPGTLPGVDTLLKQAWSLYTQRLGTLLGIAAIPLLVLVGLIALLIVGGLGSMFGASSTTAFDSRLVTVLLISLVGFLALFIVHLWSAVALLYALKEDGGGIAIGEAYRRALPSLVGYGWIVLLMGLIIGGGFVFLIIPGILFAIWFSLAPFVLIAENERGMNALLKSQAYVRGRTLGVLGRLLFIGVVSQLIVIAPGTLLGSHNTSFMPLVALWHVVAGFFLGPLVMSYLFVLYRSARATSNPSTYAPTVRQKALYISVGVLGLLCLLILPILIAYSILLLFSV